MVTSTGSELRELLEEQTRLRSEVHIMDGILRYRVAHGLYGSDRGLYEHHGRTLSQSRAKLVRAREIVSAWRLAVI